MFIFVIITEKEIINNTRLTTLSVHHLFTTIQRVICKYIKPLYGQNDLFTTDIHLLELDQLLWHWGCIPQLFSVGE